MYPATSRPRRSGSRAAEHGARLAVLPEAFPTGYDITVFAQELPTLTEPEWLSPLQEIVDTTGITVVLNSAISRNDRNPLTDIVLSPVASPWDAYDKQHLYTLGR